MIAEIFIVLTRPAKYDIIFMNMIIIVVSVHDKLDLFYV